MGVPRADAPTDEAILRGTELIIHPFGYAHTVPSFTALGRTEGPLRRYDDGLLVVHGFHVEVFAFGGEVHYTFAESGMQDGSLLCTPIQAAVNSPAEVTELEGLFGCEARRFAAVLSHLPDTPPTDRSSPWARPAGRPARSLEAPAALAFAPRD